MGVWASWLEFCSLPGKHPCHQRTSGEPRFWTSPRLPWWFTVKNQAVIQVIQVRFLGQEDTPEKGMATHSSILGWRIPWTDNPWSLWGLFGGSDGKESACNAGDLGSIPGLRRSPGEENGNPLQNSCLENPMDRGAWGHKQSGTTERLTHTRSHKLWWGSRGPGGSAGHSLTESWDFNTTS